MSRPIIVLEGRLTRDVEEIAAGKGRKFSVACQLNKDETAFYNVAAWDANTISFLDNYFEKGSGILVSGTLDIKRVDVEKGGYYVNVTANNVQFGLSSGKKSTEEDDAVEAPKEDVDI